MGNSSLGSSSSKLCHLPQLSADDQPHRSGFGGSRGKDSKREMVLVVFKSLIKRERKAERRTQPQRLYRQCTSSGDDTVTSKARDFSISPKHQLQRVEQPADVAGDSDFITKLDTPEQVEEWLESEIQEPSSSPPIEAIVETPSPGIDEHMTECSSTDRDADDSEDERDLILSSDSEDTYSLVLTKENARTYQRKRIYHAFHSCEARSAGGSPQWYIHADDGTVRIVGDAKFAETYEPVAGEKHQYRKKGLVLAVQISTTSASSSGQDHQGEAGDFLLQDQKREQWRESEATFYAKYEEVSDHLERIVRAGLPAASDLPTGSQIQTIEAKRVEKVNAMLATLNEWNFDMFTLARLTYNGALVLVGVQLSRNHDFSGKLAIAEATIRNFYCELERGYLSNPYHNSTHAADVLQTTNSLIMRSGFADRMKPYEQLAVLVAAAGHDIGHPGTTNSFQILTGAELAIQHNDQSVLENYHCAKTFTILNRPHCALAKGLSVEQYRDFRKIVISCILATDLGNHKKYMNDLAEAQRVGFEFALPSHRSAFYNMVIKCADVSHVAKCTDLHVRWSDLVQQEFKSQAEKERVLGIPVTTVVNTDPVENAKGQIGFINFLCGPMFYAYCDVTHTKSLRRRIAKNLRYWEGVAEGRFPAKLHHDSLPSADTGSVSVESTIDECQSDSYSNHITPSVSIIRVDSKDGRSENAGSPGSSPYSFNSTSSLSRSRDEWKNKPVAADAEFYNRSMRKVTSDSALVKQVNLEEKLKLLQFHKSQSFRAGLAIDENGELQLDRKS